MLEAVAVEKGFLGRASRIVAEVEFAAAGVEGCGYCFGFVGEDNEAGDGEDRNGGRLGEAFGCGEADADAGEGAGAICHNDGCYFGEGDVVVVEEVTDGGDELGGVGFAGEFGLAEDG